MSQISAKLRHTSEGFSHWCPACEQMHHISINRDGGPNWTFDGNVEAPTFAPSVRIGGKQRINEQGRWTGEWRRGPDGKALDGCCHYFLHAGQLQFLPDCTHALAGQTIPLPDLPDFLKDEVV